MCYEVGLADVFIQKEVYLWRPALPVLSRNPHISEQCARKDLGVARGPRRWPLPSLSYDGSQYYWLCSSTQYPVFYDGTTCQRRQSDANLPDTWPRSRVQHICVALLVLPGTSSFASIQQDQKNQHLEKSDLDGQGCMCLPQRDLKHTEQGHVYFDAPTNLARAPARFAVDRDSELCETRDQIDLVGTNQEE